MQTINTDNIRTEFSTSADENIRSMKKQIRIEENFDILTREIIIGGKKAGFFFIDGFVQEDMIEKLMQFFYSLKPEDSPDDGTFYFELPDGTAGNLLVDLSPDGSEGQMTYSGTIDGVDENELFENLPYAG